MRKNGKVVSYGAVLALFFSCFVFVGGGAWGEEPVLPVKVCVLSMFEIGENSGDFAGEFQHWYENFFEEAQAYEVPGMPNPFYLNSEGMGGTVTGMGKAQSASTLTALLGDPRFDFSRTFFIVSGCAGGSPERTTLGSVVWCYAAVDYELGHSWKESDGPLGRPTFLMMEDFRDSGHIPLNKDFTLWAWELTKDVPLQDDPKAQAYRELYLPEAANGTPSVQQGVSVTGDSYWHGKGSSKTAEYICSLYDAGTYGVTQMEDSAFAKVLKNFGHLERMLILRDVVNFDQPHPDQTVEESLQASSGGFSIGMTNGYRVGSRVAKHILENWETWKEGFPGK